MNGIFIAILIAGIAPPMQRDGNMPSISIVPTKVSYTYGEPIELQFMVVNNAGFEITLPINYPSFEAHGLGGIKFISEDGKLLNADQMSGGTVPQQSKALLQKIGPGDRWSTNIYLQRYLKVRASGDYSVGYELELPLLAADGSFKTVIKAKGKLSLHITPANDILLQQDLSVYSRRLGASDFWTSRPAIEALGAFDSPAVIPELARMSQIGYADRAFEALAKFKGHPRAEAIVTDALRSRKPSHEALALGVLAKWKAAAARQDIEELLKSDESRIRIRALQYIRDLKDPSYLPLITDLTNDPDPTVSAEAKQTKEVLQRSH